MLKITESIELVVEPKKTETGAGVDNIISGNEVINQISSTKKKNQAKTTKSKILVKSKNHDFLPNSGI